ncbi:MAG TPA: transcriptional repressor LexA [bacterium]|nr:transcriptional repressor LexA [bacterium]
MELTERQKEILDYIEKRIRENGSAPTIREIGERFSFSSTGSVRDHLRALADKKCIECMPGISRGIRLLKKSLSRSIPIAGRIIAGKPELALEDTDGEIEAGEKLSGRGKNFALKVKGDSMAEAGICEGDYVIVQPQNTCEQGEIVIAMLGEEATVKRFRRRGKTLLLEPANPAYKPIVIDNSVKIIGKVIGLIRYYR